MRLIKRRPFLLLEVLIAFVFVVSAFFPLIYPHFYIYQQQRQFINKIEIDLAVNEFYGAILVQLQRNQIAWQLIEEKHVFTVDEQFWRQLGYEKNIPFVGTYQFSVAKQKKNDRYGLYQVELTLTVTPKGPVKDADKKTKKSLIYNYNIFVSRLFTKA